MGEIRWVGEWVAWKVSSWSNDMVFVTWGWVVCG